VISVTDCFDLQSEQAKSPTFPYVRVREGFPEEIRNGKTVQYSMMGKVGRVSKQEIEHALTDAFHEIIRRTKQRSK
jgi:hypothetical protein